MCIGNLVQNPDMIETKNGNNVCKFSVAINDPVKKSEVLFMNVECWNKVAENCSKYLKKGSKVLVEGSLVSSTWKKNEEIKTRTFIRAEYVSFFPKSVSDNYEKPEESNLNNQSVLNEDELLMKEFEDVPF